MFPRRASRADQAARSLPYEEARGASPIGALVIGGALGSLALARSLGRRGIPVRFLTSDNTITGFSRYVVASGSCPAPGDPGALRWLLNYAQANKLNGWALFPGGDPEVKFVAQNHEVLAATFRVTLPSWDVVQWAHNKRLTYQRADELGIDYPRTHHLRSRADIETGEFRFPLVLKPTSRDTANAFTMAKAWMVTDRAELLALFDEAVGLVGEGEIVCQEYVPGDGATQFSYAALCDGGVPLASLVTRRTRQYPVEFGKTSTFVETCANRQVAEASERFLASLNYSGLVELEFKYDRRDERYKLLDVNPRLWNWISLGAAAGVAFPLLAWQLATGEAVAAGEGRPGHGWVHFSRDMLAAFQLLVRREITVAEYLRSLQIPLSPAVFARDDVVPALMDVPVVAARLLARQIPDSVRRPFSALFGEGERPGLRSCLPTSSSEEPVTAAQPEKLG